MSKEIAEIEVHSVSRPIKDGLDWTHDSWSVLIDGHERYHTDHKKPIKEKARELAEEKAPAVIKIENRDGEVFREEKVKQ